MTISFIGAVVVSVMLGILLLVEAHMNRLYRQNFDARLSAAEDQVKARSAALCQYAEEISRLRDANDSLSKHVARLRESLTHYQSADGESIRLPLVFEPTPSCVLVYARDDLRRVVCGLPHVVVDSDCRFFDVSLHPRNIIATSLPNETQVGRSADDLK